MVEDVIQELIVLIFVHQDHTFQKMNILLDDLLSYTNEIRIHNNQLEIVVILYEQKEMVFVKTLYTLDFPTVFVCVIIGIFQYI
jgi:hypothetical protein